MLLSRLFEITYLLLDRGALTARELSERFEVSTRTIYRDIENLSAAGIPVYMTKGRNGGIRLLPNFVLDKAVLTQSEREEILTALDSLKAVGYGTTLKKLGALFGDGSGSWIEVDFSGWSWGEELKEQFELLKKAVLNRRVVSFTYYSAAGGGKSCRHAEPLKLVFRGQAWYLYAWCRLRGDYRFFKLSRMEEVAVSDEIIDRRAPELIAGTERPGEAPEVLNVKFRAEAAAAFRIYDEYRHSAIRREPDGRLIVSATMPRGEWLVSYFLTFGQQVEILEPESLRREIRDELEASLAKYINNI
jgi:predicted DNA-binding transcriptional regulator YafY